MAKVRKRNHGYLCIPPIPNRTALNQPLVDIVILALKGRQLSTNKEVDYDYILNHCIRQYIIPEDNWHLSKAAQELWDSLTSDDIRKYDYKQPIHCDRANQTLAKRFKGSNSKGSDVKIHKGDVIPFNNLFTAEHMTPVADIIKDLKKLKDITPEAVTNVLDKIHICRITKEEDRKIKPSVGRGTDYNDIIKNGAYKNIPLIY